MEVIEVAVDEFVVLTCKIISGSGKLATKWIIDGEEVKNGKINPNILACYYLLILL